ncbi:TIR domain-containing protein [Phthorimaea operculella]|nr:TIR domain-containing protein [Phthorimaea operculella]
MLCDYVHGSCLSFTELYVKNGQIMQVRRDKYNPKYLEIDTCKNATREVLELDPERVLQNISMFWLVAIPWPFEHKTPQLERIQMNDLTSFGTWGDCSKLNYMYVKQGSAYANSNDLTKVPRNWLTNCTNLRTLDLRNLSMAEIRTVVYSAPSLEKLTLYHVKDIVTISEKNPLFIQSRPHPHLKILEMNDFSKHANLVGYDTTWADVSAFLVWQLAFLPQLESLNIFDEMFDMCTKTNSSVVLRSLKVLALRKTNTTRLCLKKFHTTNINKVELWASPLFDVQFSDFLFTTVQNIEIRFFNFGQIVNFEFTRDDYLTVSGSQTEGSTKSNVTLLGIRKSIDCDCNSDSWWFARALEAKLVTADGIICKDDSSPAEIACEWLPCDRINCDSTCEIDLSGNNIWHAGAEHVDALFSQPERRVRLARNYIVCSCDNKPLISNLQAHSRQIEDFENITCTDTNTKVGDVDISKLCEAQERDAALLKQREATLAVVIGTSFVAAFLVVLIVMLYYWRRQVKIFLYSRGWCLCCITDDEVDADRRYDIFISFCHDDTKVVVDEILPILDRDYKVCVHLRDWYPGDLIPAQITRSVEQSRRTIVIMSRNFVRSLWGSLEFQTAHVSGLVDGRPRVIMVILDDVLEKEQLPTEMRSYVKLNTYVRWDDPWFWEKLRYALPHRPVTVSKNLTGSEQRADGSSEPSAEITRM